MRIVFLDIDGVLNSIDFAKRTEFTNWPKGHLDPEAIVRLDRLVREGDAKVVVSSTWRKMLCVEELQRVLGEAGFTGEVIDTTPDFWKTGPTNEGEFERGHEIQHWLDEHKELDIESFVILDDDSDMAHLKNTNFVQTTSEHGLLDEHVEKALQILHRQRGATGSAAAS